MCLITFQEIHLLLTSFINKPDSLSDVTIFVISLFSSFEIINVVTPDPKIFLDTAASVADTAAVNPNGIKTLLANCLSPFLIKGKPVLRNGPRSSPKNPRDCPILCNRVFDNFILAEALFAKASRSFETCVLVNNNLSGILFSSLQSPTIFDESFSTVFYSRF